MVRKPSVDQVLCRFRGVDKVATVPSVVPVKVERSSSVLESEKGHGDEEEREILDMIENVTALISNTGDTPIVIAIVIKTSKSKTVAYQDRHTLIHH